MAEKTITLNAMADEVRRSFEKNRRILSFQQFFDLLVEHPERYARNSAQYIRDCFAHFGDEEVKEVYGQQRRFKLFDIPFDEGRERMVGQEEAQVRVFRLVDNFVRLGRVDKLVLLHGPNGSAKSTFVKTLMRAVEAYADTDEGALYRFNWVFPTEKIAMGGSIGFGGGREVVDRDSLETFAFLDDDLIDAKLAGTLRDHPLLLLPTQMRERLLEQIMPQAQHPDGTLKSGAQFVLSEYILRGDLSHTNRQIFDALLNSYKGDLNEVLKHVQVERFYPSRRYRRGLVTVEPQLRVDAGVRQMTANRSLGALPIALQNTMLFDEVGDLVDANRGIIEYDDLFKRHPDMNKYLLSAAERGAVALDDRILFMDMILLATGNEMFLDAFKKTAEYPSFKARMEFVRLPYLRDYTKEQAIYDEQISKVDVGKFVAPHTSLVAAMWAVLTRMMRPDPDAYPGALRDTVAKMTPLEKAELYAHGNVPEDLTQELARELRHHVRDMMDEGAGTVHYEGRYGASPREMKMLLLNAAQNNAYPCLSPLAVFDELEDMVREASVFTFLQVKPDGEFFKHDSFIETVRQRYLDILDDELQDAMGLVDDQQYEDLFNRYIDHVSQSLKGEKVYNKVTGTYEDPDTKFMEELEEQMGAEEDRDEFRQSLISSIAAAFLDDPGAPLDYRRTFPGLFSSLKRSFFEDRQKTIRKIQEHLLAYFEGEQKQLSPQELELVEVTLKGLTERFGHNRDSAREAVAFLLANRYKE